MPIETNLEKLAHWGQVRFEENEHFKHFLLQLPSHVVDAEVNRLNQEVESQVDCTACGNCCANLMINIDDDAVTRLAEGLQLSVTQFRERFVESGSHMQFLNAIPCHFLADKKCTVYAIRPSDCRQFPNLHLPGFTQRMFATFSHYARCPIIFNVIEGLKISMAFPPLPDVE